MPIIIVQGSKSHPKRVKSKSHEQSSNNQERKRATTGCPESSDDEDEYTRGLTANMSEVLNLKVYKVSKPNFIDGSTTTNLIGGDIFYQDEEDSVRAQKPVFDGDNQAKGVVPKTPKPPSLLQNIRAFKYVSTRFNKDDKSILKAVKENNQRFKMIKAGQSIAEHVPHPSVDQVLQWAIEYVNAHEHHLAGHFIHLEERIKCQMDERQTQNGKQLPTLAPKIGESNSPRGNRQISVVSSAQNNDKPIKTLSLMQQLENMKNQGTEAFLKSVTVVSDSMRKSENNAKLFSGTGARGSSKKDGSTVSEPSKPQQSRKSNFNSIRQRGTRLNVSGADDSSENLEGPIVPCKEPSSESGVDELQPVFEVNETEIEDGESSVAIIDEVEPQLETALSHDVVQLTRQNDSEKDNVDCGVRSPTIVTTIPQPKIPKKVSIIAVPKAPKPTQGVKYSNAKIESATPSSDGKINVATQEAIDDMKRTQMLFVKSLGYTMNIFKNANENQKSLEIKTQKRLSQANNNGNKLFNEFTSFQSARVLSDKRAEHSLKDREYHRGETFEAKSSIFANDQLSFASAGGNIHDDMKKLRQNAREYTENKHIGIILDVKWFISAVNYLRNYMRRMNNQAPPCCLKFLSILEQVIYMSFIVDASIFYKILLSDIFVRDDYRKNVVHQLIDVVREGLGIAPEEFVKFLENNDLQVPPELMNLVRSNAQIAQKVLPSREKKERPSGAPKTGSISFSSDVVVINEPEITLNNYLSDQLDTENKALSVQQFSVAPTIISEHSVQNRRVGLMITAEDI